jgi:hypothetical protein
MRGTIYIYWLALFHFVTSFADTTEPAEQVSDYNDDKLDCAMRRLMFDTARKTTPWRKDMFDIFSALELNGKCQESYDVMSTSRRRTTETTWKRRHNGNKSDGAYTVFVSPDSGDDAHNGNRSHPFSSFERGLQATRTFTSRYQQLNNCTTGSTTIPNRTIVLHEGVHYLGKTVVLTPMDSNLVIKSAPNQMAWLSGGRLIKSENAGWTKTKENDNIWVADLSSLKISAIAGLFTVKSHERMTLARFPNADVEEWDHPNRYISRNDVEEWIFPPFEELPQFYSIDLTKPDNPTGHVKNDSIMDQYNSYGTGQVRMVYFHYRLIKKMSL